MGKHRTQEEFISDAKKIHGDKYDYSKVVFTRMKDKITIICPKHGEFEQRAIEHLGGSGCPKCVHQERTLTKEEFVKKVNQIHNFKYDYTKSNYVNTETKVCIICPEHGEFWMTPNSHLSKKQGCPYCAGHMRKTNEQFIKDAREVHGDKYDYSKVNYINNRTDIIVTCPTHGDFNVKPDNHLAGNGCPKCAGKHRTTEELLQLLKDSRGDRYDYSLASMETMDDHYCIPIICGKHGIFRQNYRMHLNGANCPVCSNGISKEEFFLFEFIKNTLGHNDTVSRVRGVLSNPLQELDIYIPSKKIAIEYDGLIWHSDKFNKDTNYHFKKN